MTRQQVVTRGEKIEQTHVHTNSAVDFELHFISICLLLSLGDTVGILVVSRECPDAQLASSKRVSYSNGLKLHLSDYHRVIFFTTAHCGLGELARTSWRFDPVLIQPASISHVFSSLPSPHPRRRGV